MRLGARCWAAEGSRGGVEDCLHRVGRHARDVLEAGNVPVFAIGAAADGCCKAWPSEAAGGACNVHWVRLACLATRRMK